MLHNSSIWGPQLYPPFSPLCYAFLYFLHHHMQIILQLKSIPQRAPHPPLQDTTFTRVNTMPESDFIPFYWSRCLVWDGWPVQDVTRPCPISTGIDSVQSGMYKWCSWWMDSLHGSSYITRWCTASRIVKPIFYHILLLTVICTTHLSPKACQCMFIYLHIYAV